MDSNSWEIVDPAPSSGNPNNEENNTTDESDSDKEFTRQSSRYGQNVKNYE